MSCKIAMRLIGHHATPANRNLKDYPFRVELYHLLKQELDCVIYMIGDSYKVPLKREHKPLPPSEMNQPIYGDVVITDLSYKGLLENISEMDTWVAVDSFYHHAAGLLQKPGVAILGPWKTANVGYATNINLEMSSEHQIPYMKYMDDEKPRPKEAFPSPEAVVKAIKEILTNNNINYQKANNV